MNGFDLVLLLAAAVAAIGGWRMGFLRRLGGWIGVAGGLALAVVILPPLVKATNFHSDRTIFIFGGIVLILLATAGQGIGESIGMRLRSGVDTSGGRYVDSLGGSALGVVGVGVIVWLLLPIMAGAQGWPAQTARSSTIAQAITRSLPAPPPQIGELERQLTGGGFPRLFENLRPAPQIEPPPAQVDLPQDIYDRTVKSVVKVESPACGKIQSGSGFVADSRRVVTNAHVVAGARSTTVLGVDGRRSAATVVHFDPQTDLAVLAVDTQSAPLPIAAPKVGDQGLVMGFPGGGPFNPSPFGVAERIRATGFDIYDRNRVDRELLILSSDLRPGDSGSAVVRSDGAVVGVAVAIAPDRPSVAYALDSSELNGALDDSHDSAVSTGPCR